MIAKLLVGMLCAYLLSFSVLFLLIGRRLGRDKMGTDAFAVGNLILGAAYVLQLLEGSGSTPISRTVLKELRTSDPAWHPFCASLGCGVARCSQTHPLVPHPVCGSSFDRSAHA